MLCVAFTFAYPPYLPNTAAIMLLRSLLWGKLRLVLPDVPQRTYTRASSLGDSVPTGLLGLDTVLLEPS